MEIINKLKKKLWNIHIMYKICSTLGCLPWFFSCTVLFSVCLSCARCSASIPRRDWFYLLLDGGSVCSLRLLDDFHFLNFFPIRQNSPMLDECVSKPPVSLALMPNVSSCMAAESVGAEGWVIATAVQMTSFLLCAAPLVANLDRS